MFDLDKERNAFERYIIGKYPHRSAKILTQKQDGDESVYRIASIEECWETWQARAALSETSDHLSETSEVNSQDDGIYAPKIPTDKMINYCQKEKERTGKSKSYIFDDIYAYKMMIESLTKE